MLSVRSGRSEVTKIAPEGHGDHREFYGARNTDAEVRADSRDGTGADLVPLRTSDARAPGASQDDCGFLALRMSSAGPSESSEDQAFRISGGCVPP